MPECDPDEHRPLLVWLIFCVIGLSAAISFILNVCFAYKWHTEMNPDYRNKYIPRLCAALFTVLTFERSARLLGFWLRYYASRLASRVVNGTITLIAPGVIIGSVFVLLTLKLTTSFKDSVYELTKQEEKRLFFLIVLDIITVYLFWAVNAIPTSFKFSLLGRVIRMLLAILFFIQSVYLMIVLNSGFLTRLEQLVSKANAHSARTPTGSMSPRYSLQSPRSDSHRSGSADEVAVEEHHSVDQQRRKSTIAAIRQASVEQFSHSHQMLLLTASKSAVVGIWLTIAMSLFFTAGILFSLGRCANWANIAGNATLMVAYPIIALSLSFSLPHSTTEFSLCCGVFSDCVTKVVAWRVARQTLEIELAAENPLHSGSDPSRE